MAVPGCTSQRAGPTDNIKILCTIQFLSDPGKPVVQSLGLDVTHWLTDTTFWDLTDVTLADQDTNSILTEKANRAIQGNVAMQTTQSGGQLWNQCHTCFTCKWQVAQSSGQIHKEIKWCQVMVKFRTNPSGTMCRLRDDSSYGLGPLCLQQCFETFRWADQIVQN